MEIDYTEDLLYDIVNATYTKGKINFDIIADRIKDSEILKEFFSEVFQRIDALTLLSNNEGQS